jgi:hypothetical protein
MANEHQQQQQPKKGGGQQVDSATKRRRNRKVTALTGIIIFMLVVYFARVTGIDAAIPKILGTVGYWLGKDWETPVRISLGTAEHLLFFVAGVSGWFLSKQQEV